MKPRALSLVIAALLALTALVRPAAARDTEVPRELAGVDIDDRRGAWVPRDVMLRDAEGRPVRVGDYLGDRRPLVLVLAYYDCPMLCSLVINSVLKEMKALRWTAGDEYRVLVVSFDPRDTPESARAKQQNYLGAYGRPAQNRGFDFDVGDEKSVKALADAVGFHYRWDEAQRQFAHAAGAFVITPDGRVSRTLYGLEMPDMKLALLEASEGRIGNAVERALLFCFHYDPDAKGYKLATLRLVKASGALTLAVLGIWLFGFWRSERRKSARLAEQRS